MATTEQIKRMLRKIEQLRPDRSFHHMDETQAGMGAVLGLLCKEKEPVTAGMISEKMKISTARVAVLLRKLSEKGLITKERSPEDARVTIVQLTPEGKAVINRMHEEMFRQMGLLIDTVGEDRLTEYLEISKVIHETVTPPKFHFEQKFVSEKE